MGKVNFHHALSLTILVPALATVLAARADTLIENFATNPFQDGWAVFGDTNLFQWDPTNQDLAVTWDSSQPNSYFYHPLGNILAIEDDFSVEFDLQMVAVSAVGTFEVAVDLLNFSDATNTTFSRPAGDAPNLFEFDYFPDTGYGPTIAATLSDMTVNATNDGDFYFAYDTLPLNVGVAYHIALRHAAGGPGLSGEVLTNGQIYSSLPSLFSGPITDFRLDTASVTSYSAAGDPYGDSLLAQGMVGNIVVTLPPPPVQHLTGAFTNGSWQVCFTNRASWVYTLQRTLNYATWRDVSISTPGNGTVLFLVDTNAPIASAFYRVRANRL